jgi:hypothetical protein
MVTDINDNDKPTATNDDEDTEIDNIDEILFDDDEDDYGKLTR